MPPNVEFAIGWLYSHFGISVLPAGCWQAPEWQKPSLWQMLALAQTLPSGAGLARH
jgi:hypothetical protein